jgi:hypothetical protein
MKRHLVRNYLIKYCPPGFGVIESQILGINRFVSPAPTAGAVLRIDPAEGRRDERRQFRESLKYDRFWQKAGIQSNLKR